MKLQLTIYRSKIFLHQTIQHWINRT